MFLFTPRFAIRYAFGGEMPEMPEFDPELALTDPILRAVREQVRVGNWRAGKKAIEDADADWPVRRVRLSVLADVAEQDDMWLRAWLEAEPSDPDAALIEAMAVHGRAGTARGGASAADTSEEQFAEFHRLSASAAQLAQRAIDLAGPADPVPFEVMLSTMFGSTRGSFERVFAEGRRRDPHNLHLHLQALTLRCEKWYGSHEEMFTIARDVAMAAPPGHRSVLLPLTAHFEYALREFAWGAFHRKQLTQTRKYFLRPEVRQELEQCIVKFRAGPHGAAPLGIVLDWMATYYCLTQQRAQAKAVFDELGQHVTAGVQWGWFWGSGEEHAYFKNWLWANGRPPGPGVR
ncbi:hypothetical protein QLQ12_34440 [Actinoplanes sp. NEAU-A12]|uniref:DUF4034 domain-containing protein n=1 Tax=Actinoplanes sandaracinus TaxID=3045177 RepID=A0ABT6WVF7_9ACTN|nr:hypothetical protein [Actinoplanes sandaracinus]MDI6103726.1 hypothetical protein [Actinoplanes sandaracinus]